MDVLSTIPTSEPHKQWQIIENESQQNMFCVRFMVSTKTKINTCVYNFISL